MKSIELDDSDFDVSSPFIEQSFHRKDYPSILDRFSDNQDLKERLHDYYHFKIEPNLGIIFALISQLFNSVMVLMCKMLLMDEKNSLNPLQILLIRMSITYVLSYLYMWYHKIPDYPFGPKEVRGLLLTRGVSGFFGVSSQYYALYFLTISDTTAITFMGPTVTAILAWYFLKERYTKPEALCGVISLIGVILVARPSFIFGDLTFGEVSTVGKDSGEVAGTSTGYSAEVHDPVLRLIGSLSAFGSCITSSISMICIRKIGFRAHPLLSVACFSLITFIISGLIIIFTPSLSLFSFPVGWKQWFMVINLGVSGFLMQFLLTAGMQREKASTGMAMSYTQLCYSTIYDYVFFHHIPNLLSVLGTLFIITSAILVIYYKTPAEVQNIVELEAFDVDVESGNINDNQEIDSSKISRLVNDEEGGDVDDIVNADSMSLHHLSSNSDHS